MQTQVSGEHMSRILLSVDLDWFNGTCDPVGRLKELLCHVPGNTPAIITVEHHEFLPQLHKLIRAKKVLTPFDVVNFDEHHDYYYNNPPFDPLGNEINCAVWGYRLPLDWYKRYIWVYNKRPNFSDWEEAQSWLTDVGISFSAQSHYNLNKLESNIVATVFCISPDYLDYDMLDVISPAIEVVVKHFELKMAPLKIIGANMWRTDGWRIVPRH